MNMNLTPEEKEIGKQNFYAAIGSQHTRRDFLKKSLAATLVAGGSLGAFYFGYESIKNPLRVGVIGTGDEGSVLIGAMNPDYLQVVAIADIRPYSVYRAFHGEVAQPARPGLMSVYGWKTEAGGQRSTSRSIAGDYQRPAEGPQRRGRGHRPAAPPARSRWPSRPCRPASTCSPRSSWAAPWPSARRWPGSPTRPRRSSPSATSGTTTSSTTTPWTRSSAGSWATSTTSAPSGTAARTPGSPGCRRARGRFRRV